ncbi:MAG TPA: hypothetical protein PLK87_15900 [Verrucomicrobiota bacterium]|nr:hypothetical protein [Verrucomicrobiota bacterium]
MQLAIVVLAVFYVVKALFFRRTAQKNIIPATHLLRIWISSSLVLASTFSHATAATNAAPADLAAAVQRLQEQLDEQTKRIDRLYRAIGPQLAEMEDQAAAREKEEQEDKTLALDELARLDHEALTSLGCVNPVAAEFAAITREGALRLFDSAGKVIKEFSRQGQKCRSVAFSPNGAELLAGTESGALLVWNVASSQCAVLCTNLGRKVGRVTWLGNDRVAWGATTKYWEDDGKAVDHDKPGGAVLARDTGKTLWTFRGFVRDDFFTLAGARDGRHLAVLEIPGLPRGAFLLDGLNGEVLRTFYDEEHGSGPLSVGISPDGNTVAVGYAPWDVILWDTNSGAKRKLLDGHSNWVVSLAFSADGKQLISGAGDSTARIWDVESGKEIGRIRFPGESTYVQSVGLSPDGEIAFALVQGTLVVAKQKSAARADQKP